MLLVTNVEKSELVIARILVALLDRGFQAGGLECSDLELPNDHKDFFDESVKWLNAEGIVRFDEFKRHNGYQGMFNPTLTSKGFKLLGSAITVGEERVELKEIVADVSKQNGAWSQMGEFTGGLLGSFTKSVSS